jgi:Aspartyl protease
VPPPLLRFAVVLVSWCSVAAAVPALAWQVPGEDSTGVPIRLHFGRASTIPFDTSAGLIILTGRINGKAQVRLLLDTGDPSGFTLDDRTARAVGLSLTDRTPTRATGVVGSESFDLYRARVRSFLLGGLSAHDFSIWTAPDAALLRKMTGTRVDGFVGVDLLRGLVVTIDYPARQITFAPPAGHERPAAPAVPPVVPIRLEGNRIVVEATLNGSEKRAMILDTAAGTTFIGQPDMGLTRPSATGAMTQVVDSSGSAASLPVRILPSLAFGGAVAQDVPVVPYDFGGLNEGLFAGTPQAISGIIGSDLLSRFVLVIDFPGGTLRAVTPQHRPGG